MSKCLAVSVVIPLLRSSASCGHRYYKDAAPTELQAGGDAGGESTFRISSIHSNQNCDNRAQRPDQDFVCTSRA
jgi:hypothetical protein